MPEIAWLKNGCEMSMNESRTRIEICDDGSIILHIDECQLDDSGNYELVAENIAGVDRCKFQLIVTDEGKRMRMIALQCSQSLTDHRLC